MNLGYKQYFGDVLVSVNKRYLIQYKNFIWII